MVAKGGVRRFNAFGRDWDCSASFGIMDYYRCPVGPADGKGTAIVTELKGMDVIGTFEKFK